MAPHQIVDSHIHLWAPEISNEAGHAWMTAGHPLAKPHLPQDYVKITEHALTGDNDLELQGAVYVETDSRYDPPNGDVATWAHGPLKEIECLRAITEGKHGARHSKLLLGLVLWAPMDQPTAVLEDYLRVAEERAGTETWKRVKGFRFLLQAIHSPSTFKSLVLQDPFISNLKLLGRLHYTFDVGVDQHSAGTWQLETVAKAMALAHEGVPDEEQVAFVLNHLCKPDFTSEAFQPWRDAITAVAKIPTTYMKLSGAFSELPKTVGEQDVAHVMEPWVSHAFTCFGPRRIMFGSDWPVCNVRGPRGEESWAAWKAVVKDIVADSAYGLSEEDREWVWSKTAAAVYRLH